jgi:hypothetical protein
MNQGLIPLVTEAAGLDIDDCCILIDPCTSEQIQRVAHEVHGWGAEKCRQISLQARQAALQKYSEERFHDRLKQALETLLSK